MYQIVKEILGGYTIFKYKKEKGAWYFWSWSVKRWEYYSTTNPTETYGKGIFKSAYSPTDLTTVCYDPPSNTLAIKEILESI